MTFEAIVVDPRREPVPAGWAALARAAGLPATWDADVLAALAWCERHRRLLAVVADAGGAPCALFAARHVAPALRRGYGGSRLPGLLECHLPPAITQPGHAFHPDLDAAGRAEAVRVFERAAARRLGARAAGVVYRQVGADDLPAFRGLGRLVRPALPEAVVDNVWDGFDGYLRHLPRRDRRNLQRILRLVDRSPDVAAAVEDRLDGAEAARLLHNVQVRHSTARRAPAPFPAVYHDLLGGRPGVRYFTYRSPAGALLAYGLLVDDGRTMSCQGWGALDGADGGRDNLYFDHFLRQIAHLIEQRRGRLILGKTMTELKERFGARNVPLYGAAALRGAR
ncbi:hypothetical protein [Actinomadura parmotrematis]|uniref:GNAT family N-acetyltransferase n=1 Tax=Actinomadura parmotrematis TaxID=2864039 RepID=A0ABS7FLC5_9ACTN|nr:hypothetical protein [Actinomadura parmotrematis]MBW8481172.1 hypothetical protein [Actinomadura parmotrematis]